MPVIKIKKNRNYTVMCNHHLRNKNLSLDTKGLLSIVLSLPDDWKYSKKGFITMLGVGKEKIKRMFGELESEGYLKIEEHRGTAGHFEYIYTFYEIPEKEENTTDAGLTDAGYWAPANQHLLNTIKENTYYNGETITEMEESESESDLKTESKNTSESCAHSTSCCSHSSNCSESKENPKESNLLEDPMEESTKDKIIPLEENRSEGAELNDRVPHSANVNSNPFGTAQENRSKGIEGYLSGLGKRMGLYSSYNLRNTAKLYRSAKSDMENNGIDFESFMKAVEENITLQDASPKENKVEIRRLDDVFKKWDKIADQLKASGVWSDVKLPSGWVLKENPGYRPTEYDRYLLYKDGLCERTRYRDGVIAFSDNDGHNFVYVKIILDVKKDGSAKFKGIKISKDPEEF